MSDNTNAGPATKSDMTKEDSARVQSTQATGDKDMSSSGFAARAQSAGDKHDNAGAGGQATTGGSNNSGGADKSGGK